MSAPTELNRTSITVSAADLPLHCPMPSMKQWSSHPRVFIDVSTTGEAKCPYCGTVYKFDGPHVGGH
ncbi:hypothetical protein AEM42_11695 [Betaproteobacteria bacterium UKL13-2]|jgi:uncharacterized Zn-finger protein|nr:hypothetical protein AEM42_11695 [Betaproteobacteria bacterium UKL13-2]HCG52985.1 zinc-finger domain-containing protein [Betaproteobacteria bacterium]